MTPTSLVHTLTKFTAAAFVAAAVGTSANAQITGNDTAANYGGGWTTGSNGGSGFGNWTITSNSGTSGFAGAFTGNAAAAGITGMADPSFSLYANPDGSGAFVTASRSFQDPLSVGRAFSFKWANNWDTGGSGNKGFTISAGGTEIINVNQSGFPGNITFSGNNTGIGYGTSPMTWTFNRTSSTNLLVTATGRDGNSTIVFSANVTISAAPTSFSWYVSNLSNSDGDNRQPYFNDLLITGNYTPDAPLISGTSYAVAAAGASFTYQISASPAANSYNATGLPGGLTLNSTSGLISGTPSGTGTSNVTLTATNEGGTSTPFNLTIAVGVGADSAQNYSGNWTTGSNQGIGFGNWTLSTSGNGSSGSFIGSPSFAGISGMPFESFALYANPNSSGASSNAERSLSSPLSQGQSLSFQWGINWDSGSDGNKGFVLSTADGESIVVSNTASSNITIETKTGNATSNTGLGFGTAAMLWTFTQTTNTSLSITATPRGSGETFATSLPTTGPITSMKFYAYQMQAGDNAQPYFNNFLIQGGSTPQPTAYDSWATFYGLNATVTTGPTAGAPAADPDSDSFTNQQEYAFGTNPAQATAGLVTTSTSSGNLTVVFLQRSDLTYNVQSTDNLSTIPFSNNTAVTSSVTNSPSQDGVPDGYTRRQFTITPSGSKNFYRVIATEQTPG